jgi:hypothetical protein
MIGAYLTASTLVLFYVARNTTIFQDMLGLPALTDPELRGLLYIFVCHSFLFFSFLSFLFFLL